MKRTVLAAIASATLGAATLPVLADANHGRGNERGGPRAGFMEPGYPGMPGQDIMGPGMMGVSLMRGGMVSGADHVLRLLDADGGMMNGN